MSAQGTCWRKRQYPTREDAMEAQRELQRTVRTVRERKIIRAYECPYSKLWPSEAVHWHVGHVERKKAKR